MRGRQASVRRQIIFPRYSLSLVLPPPSVDFCSFVNFVTLFFLGLPRYVSVLQVFSFIFVWLCSVFLFSVPVFLVSLATRLSGACALFHLLRGDKQTTGMDTNQSSIYHFPLPRPFICDIIAVREDTVPL